jgi:hypothetical protein
VSNEEGRERGWKVNRGGYRRLRKEIGGWGRLVNDGGGPLRLLEGTW